MKLILPYIGEMTAADRCLLRLAEFLGIDCESVRLDKHVQQPAEYIENLAPDQHSCLVINPHVMREWVGRDTLSSDLVSCLITRFRYLLVHAVTLDPSATGIVSSLSGGRLAEVRSVKDTGQPYEIPKESKDVCGPFSGLSFGTVNAGNDRVFCVMAGGEALRYLIRIGNRPLMAAMTRGAAKIIFVASEDVADLNAYAGYAPLDDYFSRFMPQAMALRYVFGEHCWHPLSSCASIIVDDPLLRPNYGFLNFETLLRLVKEHGFHTSVAFIPHNYRRNSKRILNMFKENPAYLSICYHGNDHTGSEFASHDVHFLNTALSIAETRMKVQYKTTGLRCDKVMVFPQSDFSVEAMQVLKSRNFSAAVSSAWHPLGQPARPPLSDLCQPAILRYGGFPLFGRNSARYTRSQDVAFNVFFGKPILTGEHHDSFENVQYLVEGVQRINTVAPNTSWSNVEAAVSRAFLQRRVSDGTMQVRAYSPSLAIVNHSQFVERFSMEWIKPDQCFPFAQVFQKGNPMSGVEVDDTTIRAVAELPPGNSGTFSVMYGNGHAMAQRLGLRWDIKAFLRRRLSEVRDNYLSNQPKVLRVAKTLQRHLLS